MFRRSHLNYLTATNASRDPGIDFFSDNICEDHLIGDLLWKSQVPEEEMGETWGKHALLFGDLAFQPMAGMSVKEYIARRVRWLRVRKFTVTLATFVEPGTEAFLCSCYGAYGATSLPWCNKQLGIPQTWGAFVGFFLLSVILWAVVDWAVYLKLHSASTLEADQMIPKFAQPPRTRSRRPYRKWLLAWLGRELLALPIWLWAFWGGTEVVWRGTKFWVGMDMKVHQVAEGERSMSANGSLHEKRKKARSD
jgi:ceramide glucosyltransferase